MSSFYSSRISATAIAFAAAPPHVPRPPQSAMAPSISYPAVACPPSPIPPASTRSLRGFSPSATRTPSQCWQHDTRLDKTQEQRLQDALVNVGSSDVGETLWTVSCWFALAPRERDEAMMLSQLTFCESESLTKAGAVREEST